MLSRLRVSFAIRLLESLILNFDDSIIRKDSFYENQNVVCNLFRPATLVRTLEPQVARVAEAGTTESQASLISIKRADCSPWRSGEARSFRRQGEKAPGVLSKAGIVLWNKQLPNFANLCSWDRTQIFICRELTRIEIGPRTLTMLWTIFVVLLVLWLLGLVSSYTLGGFIHILLVLALVVLVFQLISGRRTTI
jgi:hypothetical protein